MPSIKEYKAKIHSLNNIEKITRTMKLVSASKLRQAHKAQSDAKLYAKELTSLIARLEASVESELHPLLLPKENVRRVLLLIFTSDKGLCGGFNNNLCKRAHEWIRQREEKLEQIDLSFCGKRGHMFFKKREHPVKKHYEAVTVSANFHNAKEIGDELIQSYLTDEYQEIYLGYNTFLNPLSQRAIFEKILPIKADNLIAGGQSLSSDYIFEPEKKILLETLIPKYVYFKLHYTLLENAAGEHGARMTAMDSATKNAGDLIDKYVLLRNRARQAAITTELTEIVSGAEALK